MATAVEEAKKVEPKPHISPSQLNMFARCPAQYERRYIKGEIIPPGIAMLQGSAVHKGAEVNFEQKIESREDLPEREIIDVAASAFDVNQAAGYQFTPDEESIGSKKVLGRALDQVVAMAAMHARHQAPAYQPIAVEHYCRIELPQASRDIVAISDLWDDQDRVIDFKTAKRKSRQGDVDSSVQLTVYAAAFQIEQGHLPREVRLDVLVKTATPTRQVLSGARTLPDLQALVNRVNETLRQIEAGIFPPCAPDHWMCDPRYCGYYHTCPYVH